MPRRRAAGTRCPASPSRDGNGRAVAMAADHGDHVTPDQFKGRARRARNPPDVAVRRRHARADRRDSSPPSSAPRPNHDAAAQDGGRARRYRTTTRRTGWARENAQKATNETTREDRAGTAGRRRTTAERSGRGGTAPTSARPRYAADPDRRPAPGARASRRPKPRRPRHGGARAGRTRAASPPRPPGPLRLTPEGRPATTPAATATPTAQAPPAQAGDGDDSAPDPDAGPDRRSSFPIAASISTRAPSRAARCSSPGRIAARRNSSPVCIFTPSAAALMTVHHPRGSRPRRSRDARPGSRPPGALFRPASGLRRPRAVAENHPTPQIRRAAI